MKESLSLSQLSAMTAIEEEKLALLERGEKTPSLSQLYCLCNCLNIPPSEFLEISHGLR